jgi:predicted metal-dependent phosphoesterase TrpH
MSSDLHLHTTASDGSIKPAELVKRARQRGLNAIAITDHDNVDGIAEALEAGRALGVTVVPGVELSSEYRDCDGEGCDLHFLGFFINYRSSFLRRHLERLVHARYQRAYEIVRRLQLDGIHIPFEQVKRIAGEGSLGRPHIARALVEHGYVDTIQGAFRKYLERKGPYYVEKYTYSPREVIEVIRKAGGVASLAHPGLCRCDSKIPEFAAAGLQAIEVYHTDHDPTQVNRYRRLAERLGLVATGGSDCHGPVSLRGFLLGTVTVPDEVVEELRALAGRQRKPVVSRAVR